MNKQQLLAAMQGIDAKAKAEDRPMTADELAEFDRLKADYDAIDANEAATATRRAQMSAVRQASGVSERVERLALGPDQLLASLPQFQRPQGNTLRLGDFVRASLGVGDHDLRAEQTRGTGSQGGFTVPSFLAAEIIDAARARSRVTQAGARIIPVAGDTSFATIEEDPAFANHGENQSIDESEVVFGSRNFQSNTRVCVIRASVECAEDSPNFNSIIDSVLASSFGVDMDNIALNGNGVGQGLGVLQTEGVHEIDGSSLSTWSPFAKAYQAVRSSNHAPGAFIVSPGGMGAVDGLVEGGGSNQPLRRPPSLESTAFLDTTSIAESGGSPNTTQAVCGEWPLLFIAMRTPLTIEATRVGGDAFNKLSVLIRAYARMDSFVVRKAAFAKVTGIPVPAIG